MRKKSHSERGFITADELARRAGRLPPRPRVLIVCEGTSTEPIYFYALCRDKKLTGVSIKGKGSAPGDLVDFARRLQTEARNKGRQYAYEKVWCVFDEDNRPNIPEALQNAQNRGIMVAFSNPCFELWFLLHFECSTRHVDSGAVLRKLEKSGVPGYHKAMDVHAQLLEHQPRAIQHARQLRTHHRNLGGDETANPSTTVDMLVEYLNRAAPISPNPKTDSPAHGIWFSGR